MVLLQLVPKESGKCLCVFFFLNRLFPKDNSYWAGDKRVKSGWELLYEVVERLKSSPRVSHGEKLTGYQYASALSCR